MKNILKTTLTLVVGGFILFLLIDTLGVPIYVIAIVGFVLFVLFVLIIANKMSSKAYEDRFERLKNCKNCNKVIPYEEKICSSCGADLKDE